MTAFLSYLWVITGCKFDKISKVHSAAKKNVEHKPWLIPIRARLWRRARPAWPQVLLYFWFISFSQAKLWGWEIHLYLLYLITVWFVKVSRPRRNQLWLSLSAASQNQFNGQKVHKPWPDGSKQIAKLTTCVLYDWFLHQLTEIIAFYR